MVHITPLKACVVVLHKKIQQKSGGIRESAFMMEGNKLNDRKMQEGTLRRVTDGE